MKRRTYTPREYSDDTFSRDAKLQSLLLSEMKRIESYVKISFVAMFAVFAFSIVAAVACFPVAILISFPLFAILLACCVYYLMPRRRFFCGKCSEQMSIEWETSRDGKGARFALCQNCNCYADTLWTSR